jgi:hypothetical protein
MQLELEKLRSAEAVVTNTSTTISSINSKYEVYRERLSSASRTLKTLKTKLEKDDRYIYWSYMIFLLSAGWIFLRRVKLVELAQWFSSKGFNTASWVIDQASVYSVVSSGDSVGTETTSMSTSYYPTPSAATTVPIDMELTVLTPQPVKKEELVYTPTMDPESRPLAEIEAQYVEITTTTTEPMNPDKIPLTTQPVTDEALQITTTGPIEPEMVTLTAAPVYEEELQYIELTTTTMVPIEPDVLTLTTQPMNEVVQTTHRRIETISTPPSVPTTSPAKDEF